MKSKYIYQEPEEFFIINDDPSLEPIKIYNKKIIEQVYKSYKMKPYIPDFKKIDGY